jgi:hypothetical protein
MSNAFFRPPTWRLTGVPNTLGQMTQPSAQDFAIYTTVKRFLESAGIGDRPGGVTASDSLFAEGPGNVTIGSTGDIDIAWDKYMDGYYEAGELLAAVYHEETTSPWVVYPILFLYRHYLELTLKSLIFEARASFKKPSGDYPSQLHNGMDNEHNLIKLWEMFVKNCGRQPSAPYDRRRSPDLSRSRPVH